MTKSVEQGAALVLRQAAEALLEEAGQLEQAAAVATTAAAEYVDPYLYELGFFESPEERARLVASTPILSATVASDKVK